MLTNQLQHWTATRGTPSRSWRNSSPTRGCRWFGSVTTPHSSADSLTTFGDTRLSAEFDRTPEKIVHYKGSHIGLCGSAVSVAGGWSEGEVAVVAIALAWMAGEIVGAMAARRIVLRGDPVMAALRGAGDSRTPFIYLVLSVVLAVAQGGFGRAAFMEALMAATRTS